MTTHTNIVSDTNINITNLNDISCPICKKNTLQMLYKIIDIPYIGTILISTILCTNCGFKITDIWMMREKGEKQQKQQLRITHKTINYLVCASAGSKIIIPEIDAELDIKTFDAQHITTIEGLLREIHSAVNIMLPTAPDRQKALKISKLLEEEIDNPSGKLTLILEDPSGHSSLIPYDLWTKRTEKERTFLPQETLEKIGKELIKKWEKTIKNSNA